MAIWGSELDGGGGSTIQGPMGPQGPQGPTGPQGTPGTTGATGTQGIQGIQGIQGLKGDKGDKGDQGIQGIQGPVGPQGPTGPQGPVGANGTQGIQGIQGLIGPPGPTGPAGGGIISTRRGLSTVSALLNTLAWAGGDTTAFVPIGDFNPTTYSALVTAITTATSGTTIRIPPRTTIVVTSQLPNLPVGVNLIGGGGVFLRNNYTPAGASQADVAMLPLMSNTEGTNGNQYVRNITFLGNNYQGTGAIYVRARSNVKIIDCACYEFNYNFVTFNGRADETDGPATTKAVGNVVHNCASTACCVWVGAKPGGYASGIVQVGSQSGFELKDCVLIAKGRGSTNEGYPVKLYRNGYNDGMLYQNCSLRKSYSDGTTGDFIFAAEVWHDTGLVVRDCFIEGRFDLNGVTKGQYQFGAQFYNNVFGNNTLPSSSATGSGVALELAISGTPCSDIIIEGNTFKNQWHAIFIYQRAGPTGTTARITFRNNKCLNTRLAEWVAANTAQGGTTDWTVVNNTFRRLTGASAMNAGIKMPDFGTNTNWIIKRNIISGFSAAPITQGTQGGTTSGITITDNIFHSNNGGATNVPTWVTTPSSYVEQNNSTYDPVWDTEDTTSMRNAFSGTIGADEYAGLATVI